MHDLHGRRVTVMGLGQFGGGLGVSRWLAARGAQVLVTDRDTPERLEGPLSQLADLIADRRVTLRLGGHHHEDFRNTDLVVANPAVPKPWANPYLTTAREAGVAVTTEMRLLVERLAERGTRVTVGITGSAGKSTTSSLVHHLLRTVCPGALLGGNIGGSLLDAADAVQPDDPVVLELSSAMLHWFSDAWGPSCPSWGPDIGVLTNLLTNHLDWHGDFVHYSHSKRQIRHSADRGTGIFITRFHREVPDASADAARLAGDWWSRQPVDTGEDDEGLLPIDPRAIPIELPGEHNRRNALLAMIVADRAMRRLGKPVDWHALQQGVASFGGLAHRLQRIGSWDGRTFYNDSKSTTPEATLLALASFPDPARVHLIAGGYDKGSDLAPVRDLGPKLARLYAIGVTGPKLVGANASLCGTLEAAVAEAIGRMAEGDILLLSPACASWDQFMHYEQRGDRFVALVRAAMTGRSASASESAVGQR
jgi:UDP-N-acetylmuramoylalanine--D-glutamate ligase